MTIHTSTMPDIVPSADEIIPVPAMKKARIREGLRTFGFSAERLYSDLTLAARQFAEDLSSEYRRASMDPGEQ